MDLLQLKYFQKVAKLQHMTRASEELRIAQPALSKTISSLEKELGVKLFDRKSKFIELNDFGRAFLKRVDTALMLLDDGKGELDSLSGKVSGEIKLAVLAASNMLADLLTSFKKLYPDIRFKLIQHVPQFVSNQDFDLCISSSPIRMKNIKSFPLLTEEILLAVPNNHHLAKKKIISLDEVSNEDFISLQPGKDLREITDIFCNNAGFVPNIVFESDDPATVRGLIKAGLGISFIPEITWGGTTGESMTLLKVKNPKCVRTLRLFWSDQRYSSTCVNLFRQFTIDYFSNYTKKL